VPMVVARFTPLPWAAGALALLLLSVEQSLRWVVAGVVHKQLTRRAVPGWAAFAAGVYAGTFAPVVFPWSAAGGVTPWPAMVQLADLVGERGVTLLMALSAGLVAGAARAVLAREARRAATLGALGVALPLATLAYGAFRIHAVEARRVHAPTIKVGLVQPSVGAVERWEDEIARAILDRLTTLTESAEHRGAALTIWPEGAYPKPVAHASRRCPLGAWAILPYGVRGPVLTGMIMTGGHGDTWNSAAVCSADGTLSQPYDKLHLLWFGETVPYLDRIPWIRETFARGTGMLPGERNVMLEAGKARVSVLNCFEDTLPDAGRTAMADGPNLLVNVTNDAWFEGSAESELHLRLAVLRAVEARRDLVRAVNFGPTTWVDAAGRVRGRYASDLPGTLLAEPALLDTPLTFYARWGDAPTVLVAIAALFGLSRTKRQGRRSEQGPDATPFAL
jgi:apolipoprotein N-acyltransferase